MSIPTSVVTVDKLLAVVESFLLNPYKMMNREPLTRPLRGSKVVVYAKENLSTKSASPQTSTWLYEAYGEQSRPSRGQKPSPQRASTPDTLIPLIISRN